MSYSSRIKFTDSRPAYRGGCLLPLMADCGKKKNQRGEVCQPVAAGVTGLRGENKGDYDLGVTYGPGNFYHL
jgi:hypothetical protein